MDFYPETKEFFVPRDLLEVAISEMRNDGANGNEGTCLWLGERNDHTATITHAVLLRGPHIFKSPTNIRIEPELMREVHCAARDRGLILIGQVHSHGKDYGVDLSYVDRELGFRIPAFLSVVAPDYGQSWPISWLDCGVHIYQREQGFVRLRDRDVQARIRETKKLTSMLTIGHDE